MLKVLIAEDNLTIADSVEEALLDVGYDVCGIAATVDEALALGRAHVPDLAVLDLRLANDGLGTAVAAGLRDVGRIGVLYATGSPDDALGDADGIASILKPYSVRDLVNGLRLVREVMETGTAAPPYPRNFRLLAGRAAECMIERPVERLAAAQPCR